MRNSERLNVSFDGPENGWITIDLTYKERSCQFAFEHVPHDTIRQLADGVGNLLLGQEVVTAKANDGPIHYEFRFTCLNDAISFVVVILNDEEVKEEQSEIFATTGSVYFIACAFWKALRELETKFDVAEYQARWREPFPHREMELLTAQYQKLKYSVRSRG